jgi:hypothetical protein
MKDNIMAALISVIEIHLKKRFDFSWSGLCEDGGLEVTTALHALPALLSLSIAEQLEAALDSSRSATTGTVQFI